MAFACSQDRGEQEAGPPLASEGCLPLRSAATAMGLWDSQETEAARGVQGVAPLAPLKAQT